MAATDRPARADVAKPVDATDLKSVFYEVRVRVPPSAPWPDRPTRIALPCPLDLNDISLANGYPTDVTGTIRNMIRDHHRFALALLLLALCARALLPPGYMLNAGPTSIEVQLCSNAAGPAMTTIIIPHDVSDDGKADTHPAKAPCSNSSVGIDMLGGADGLLLASALAFILLLGFGRLPGLRLSSPAHLRPPLRAPPQRF